MIEEASDVIDACKLEPTIDTELELDVVNVRESEALQAQDLDAA